MSDTQKEPRPPKPPQWPYPPEDMKKLKKSQNLILAGSIMGPVSLLFGSVLLGGAGLICGILGFRRVRKLEVSAPPLKIAVRRFKRTAIVTIVICAVAFILNTIWFVYNFPIILEAVETGNYQQIFPDFNKGSGDNSSSPDGSITWG